MGLRHVSYPLCPPDEENAVVRHRLDRTEPMDHHAVCHCVHLYLRNYDWLDSAQIRACIVIAVVALLVNINRMTSIRHPYIDPQVFKYKKFPVILFLFLMLCLFLATSSVLQNAFMMSILRYDTLNAISLNWCVFVGILAGAGVVFFRQAVLKKDTNC